MATNVLSRRLTRAVAVVASVSAIGCTSIGVGATAASALTLLPSCPGQTLSTPFTPWGDTNSYFMMPGGSFESGAPGWSFAGGAGVVSGNESSFVNSKTDSHSVAIPSGAKVTSPTTCVAAGQSLMRLFVKNSGVAGSVLHVQISVQYPLISSVVSIGYDINGTAGATGWAPTGQLIVPNLGLLSTNNLTLVFTTKGTPATWNIDDVFVDPFKHR
jgi:hypothetical protein